MSERVIAKLRRKVPKFALMVARQEVESEVEADVVTETYGVLRQLGHNEADARRLLDAALAKKTKIRRRAGPAPSDLPAQPGRERRSNKVDGGRKRH